MAACAVVRDLPARILEETCLRGILQKSAKKRSAFESKEN